MQRASLVALVALFSLPAFGAGTMASSADAAFAKKAAEGGMAEVACGQLASDKGTDADVKAFGQRMVTDHSKANDDLKAAAMKSGIDLPTEPSKKQQDDKAKLEKMSGADFDRHYMTMMVKDHEEDVALFRKEAQSGKDDNLKQFAQKTLPTLEEHLSMAKKTSQELKSEGKR